MDLKRQWDLSPLFKNERDWLKACQEILAGFEQLKGYKGRLNESADILAEFLELNTAIGRQAKQIELYAFLRVSADATDEKRVAQAARGKTLLSLYQASVAFIQPELMGLGRKRLEQLQKESDRLAIYARYFDQLEDRRPYTRSAEVERVLAQLGDPFNSPLAIFGQLSNTDLTFEPAIDSHGIPHPVAPSTYLAQIVHPDRELRKGAYESFHDAHLAVKNTFSQLLASSFKQDHFKAQARGFQSTLAASLDKKKIPHPVFHNLLAVFKRKLPVWHRYWRLRREILGVKTLHEYDIKAPLSQKNIPISYEQAVAWIADSLAPLGSEYVEIVRHGALEGRWVDVYPNHGKVNTAFSDGVQGANPFILQNHSDDIFGMSILTHELGHAMHTWYTNQTQPFIYSEYTDFAGEVAANVHQALLRHHLFEHKSDPRFQVLLLEEMMSNFHRYFFLMPTLARFELDMHERVERGDPLTTQLMMGHMADLFEEGYGGEVTVDRERQGITWAQYIHLYNNYYIFQYMTGIAGAATLSKKIRSDERGAAERYLSFLKLGGYEYPIAALQNAGVDLASPEPVETAFNLMEEAINRLEALTKTRSL